MRARPPPPPPPPPLPPRTGEAPLDRLPFPTPSQWWLYSSISASSWRERLNEASSWSSFAAAFSILRELPSAWDACLRSWASEGLPACLRRSDIVGGGECSLRLAPKRTERLPLVPPTPYLAQGFHTRKLLLRLLPLLRLLRLEAPPADESLSEGTSEAAREPVDIVRLSPP